MTVQAAHTKSFQNDLHLLAKTSMVG